MGNEVVVPGPGLLLCCHWLASRAGRGQSHEAWTRSEPQPDRAVINVQRVDASSFPTMMTRRRQF